MNWTDLTSREKTEYIVRDVMGWPYFATWELAHVARWALEHEVTYPYAFWNDQQECVSIFYEPLEDAHAFNPLENIGSAWQIVEKMRTYQRPLTPDTTKDDLTRADYFLVALWKSIGRRGMEAIFAYTPELICKAALFAVNAMDEHGNVMEQERQA